MTGITGEMIAQLIIALGPAALELIPKIASIWTKTLTVDEVNATCSVYKKTYDDYIAAAKAAQTPPAPPA